MLAEYHIEIMTGALQEQFAPEALRVILDANVAQDNIRGQIGHPEFHFDHNQFARTYVYLEKQRKLILDALANCGSDKGCDLREAWQAFGRLTHAVQDFYAHSNYLELWVEKQGTSMPPSEEVEPLDQEIIQSIELRSGKIYLREVFGLVPALRPFTRKILPRDSHAWMNLDSPDRGELFPHVITAARKRTVYEYEMLADRIRAQGGEEAMVCFRGEG